MQEVFQADGNLGQVEERHVQKERIDRGTSPRSLQAQLCSELEGQV